MRSGRWQMFGACDPSVGASAQSDPSAIIVGGWDTEKQVLNVIEAAIKRRVPSKLEADLIAAQREYQMRAIGFENNGAFEIQRQNIAKAATSNAQHLIPTEASHGTGNVFLRARRD